MNTDIQIKKAYESEGMTPEQIAEDLQFDVLAVKAKLMQISSVYRKACNHESLEVVEDDPSLNFTDNQSRDFVNVIHELACDTTISPDTRLRAAIYGRDDKKGRKEIVKAVQQTGNFNMFVFNEALQNARDKMRQFTTGQGKGIVEI